jgi:phage terminase large subunit GpA-like protein
MIRTGSLSELARSVVKVVAPPPDLTVSQWADRERRLSSESSAEPGRWKTDRAPYQREIMDALNDPATETIVVMSSAQVGKTEILLNIIGYYIDQDPAPILLLQPTLEMAEAFSKDRLAPMLRDTPALKGKVKDPRSRDSGNTLLHKQFPGGHITMAGGNSPASLSSRPIRILLADEVDRYPVSAGSEGDPLSLAERRTSNFWNRKKVYVSTPGVRGMSRIEAAYENSTQEQWCLPCPSCGKLQPLTWAQLHFEDLTLECVHCGARHTEVAWKRQEGQWVARKEHPVRGFHLNALASPWKTWSAIVAEFKEAKRIGPEGLKAWVNTVLGETWEEEGDVVEEDALRTRQDHYGAEVPDGVLVLTAGVDTQDDRLEVEVVGWGLGKESWSIEYRTIYGDPGQNAVWEQLDEFLGRFWSFTSGQLIGISCTCVDSGGHFTDQVYRFCKAREHRRIFAIKGKGGPGNPAIVGKPTRNNRHRTALFTLGVDTLKELFFSRLKVEDPGPGYCHFPKGPEKGHDRAYYLGITSEKKMLRYRKGRPYIEWVKRGSGIRNEPLDCRIYATGALEIFNPDLEKLAKSGPKARRYAQNSPMTAQRMHVGRRRRVISKGIG